MLIGRVQHEVVSGLKYYHAIYRKGIRCTILCVCRLIILVDRSTYMLGSYGPKAESQTAMTPMEEVGLL